MKKSILALTVLFVSFNTFALSEMTVLKVSKTINPKNVLHYKIKYDKDTCELKSNIFAEWKMDEEDGRWKSLNDSAGMIKAPLNPKTTSLDFYEADFETDSMADFQEKGILSSANVKVISGQEKSGSCNIHNQIILNGQPVQIDQLHSKVNFIGSVKWIELTGVDVNGRPFKKHINN